MGNIQESYGRRRRDRDRRWWDYRGYLPEDIRWYVYPPYYEPVYMQPPQQVIEQPLTQPQQVIEQPLTQPQQVIDKTSTYYYITILIILLLILLIVFLKK